jgi:hypothetical protein
MNQMIPKKADPQVRQLIADIYARFDKEADAEGTRLNLTGMTQGQCRKRA